MSLSLFLSKRYILSKKDSRFVNLISIISILGIALGVATLIIALSILNGFEKTLTDKLVDFDSHIRISSYKNILPDNENSINQIKEIVGSNLKSLNSVAANLSIISSKRRKDGVRLTGINNFTSFERVKENIVEIDSSILSGVTNKILLGKKLADKLLVDTGDKVTLFALKDNEMPTADNLPNIEKFIVAGIFESGMAEYDDLYAFTEIESAQKLFSLDKNITGIEIMLNNTSGIDSLTKLLRSELRYPYAVRSVYETHRNIFTWIELQKEPIPLILGLIILVAAFNIVGTLLMIVLERTEAIGVLKSLGARRKQIVSVFLIQGSFISFIGILAGNLLAIILLELQLKFNIISLPSSVYFMSTVPIDMRVEIFVIISFITFLLAISAALIPSYIASKIQPVNALRFR